MADEEAAAKKSEDNENAAAEEKSGGKKKLIIIAIIALLLVGGGGFAAMFLLSGGDKVENQSEGEIVGGEESHTNNEVENKERVSEKGEESSEKEAKSENDKSQSGTETISIPKKEEDLGIEFGDTFAMKTFNLNLGNALENRFVRMEVTLEYVGGEKQKKEIQKRLPQLRDAVISVVSRKTREFLLAPDGKDALRKEILIRINRYMKQKIEAVYITDILIE